MQPTAPTATALPYSPSQIGAATNSSSGLMQQIQSAQSNQQTPDQILQGEDQSLGVPQAQQQVSGLQKAIINTTNLLNNVAPTVEGNTANSLVTASQQGQQIANQEAPIQTDLNQDTDQYNIANSNYENLESQAENQETADLTEQNDQMENLQNMYADSQNDLNSMLSADQNTQQLNAQEQEYYDELMASGSGWAAIDKGKNGSSSGGSGGGGGNTSNPNNYGALESEADSGKGAIVNRKQISNAQLKQLISFVGPNGQGDPTKQTAANKALADELGIKFSTETAGIIPRIFSGQQVAPGQTLEQMISSSPALKKLESFF